MFPFITLDFESKKIEPRPYFPPDPAGIAIKWPGKKGRYYAWAHRTENNCTEEDARRAMKEAWASKLPLLFHNGKFDLAVAVERMGFPMPRWDRVHDTMFLTFLENPYMPVALKPAANIYLHMPPDERDEVFEWLTAHKSELGIPGQETNMAKYIWMAPGKLVAKYAIGDVDRTEGLFKLLYPRIVERGMLHAYDVERELMPILLRNEQEGMRVNLRGLHEAVTTYEAAVERCDEWICKRLGAPGMNINSDPQLTEALFTSGVVQDFVLTKTGKRSASKDNLLYELFTDPKVFRALVYRNKLSYSLSTFMRPWAATADATGGTIHTSWNQVQREGAGAITGRLSSSPNFQNITKGVDSTTDRTKYEHPKFLKWAPELPLLRRFILPDKGQKFGHRDVSQEELRILAHYEAAELAEAYNVDPRFDMHVRVQSLLADAGRTLDRDNTKRMNFGILYGMGGRGLSRRLNIDQGDAYNLLRTWNAVMPGVASLVEDIKAAVHNGEEIVTWGGRCYGMPPPLFENGESRDRDYVLLNYLIQGSGGDVLKRILIDFDKEREDARLLLSVHDETNFTAPPKAMRRNLEILKNIVERLEFDVPFLSDAKEGPNWGDAKKVKY